MTHIASSKKHSPIMSFEYVSKTFAEDLLDYKQMVLKNIHLDIHDGEFVIIFGPSGSGKSTLLNLMAGLEFPTSGTIKVRNRELTSFSADELAKYHRQKMGMVFQNFNLIKSLNVWENVALPQTASGASYKSRFKRAQHLLKLLGLEDMAHRHPNEISGGQQQRVAIARSLINNPTFLLVDEPTGNLDSEAAKEVMNILHGLHYKAHHTIVLVTHNQDYLPYATRVIYMQDGRIEREETPTHDVATVQHPLPAEHFDRLAKYKDKL